MTFLKRVMWWERNRPIRRVRLCVECGMPPAEHRSWCPIFRTMSENRQRADPRRDD